MVRRRHASVSSTTSQAGETGQIRAPKTGSRLQYSNRLHIQKCLQVWTRSPDLTIDPAKQCHRPRDMQQKQYHYPTPQQYVATKRSMLKQHQSTEHQVCFHPLPFRSRDGRLPKLPSDCRASIPSPSSESSQCNSSISEHSSSNRAPNN